jgi:hypothetical protein
MFEVGHVSCIGLASAMVAEVHRENRVYTVCHEPYSGGKSRHGAPVRRIQSIASRM